MKHTKRTVRTTGSTRIIWQSNRTMNSTNVKTTLREHNFLPSTSSFIFKMLGIYI